MSQFIEMFEGDKYPHKTLDSITSDWLKGQSFRKDEIEESAIHPCIHYGELFTKYGPVISQVQSYTNSEPKRLSKPGDILFPASDVTPNGLARCSMLPFDDVILGGDIIILRPKEGFNSGFLSYAINNQTSQLLTRVNGGVVKHMSSKSLKSVLIPIPPKDKQEEYIRIANQADKSGFDGLKSQFIEMFTDKGYPLTMIKSFADVSTGGTPSKAHPEYWNGDKPWVSAEDMKSKYVYDTCEKVTEAGYATCKIIPVDTLMYVCRGSIGVMAINKIECATNQSICRATCHNNVCNVEFLYHALMYQRDNIKKKGTGTSFKSLNQTTFSELEIELPPYDEQMKFVTIAEQADKSGSVLQYRIAC